MPLAEIRLIIYTYTRTPEITEWRGKKEKQMTSITVNYLGNEARYE